MALVSVIVPNYNKGQFIGDTIQSVIGQSFADFELIIVDDRSTDNSVEVACSWAKMDQRIRVYVRDREPKGANTCRNIGIEKSTAKWLLFLDSDDLLMPFCLHQRIEAVAGIADADTGIFPTGTFYEKPGDSNSCWIPPAGVNYLHKFLAHDLPWNISSPLWRRETVVKTNGFNEIMNWLQDVEFHTRVLLVAQTGIRLYNKLPPDCFYRISENRLLSGHTGYVTNYVKGQLTYINEMTKLLEGNNADDKRKYLKGSLLMAIRLPLYAGATKRIPGQLEKELYDQVMNEPQAAGLLNGFDRLIIRMYRFLYRLGVKRKIDRIFKLMLVR